MAPEVALVSASSLPWNRARIHYEFMRRDAFVRWPVHGNVLEALLEGRLEVGAQALLEPGVWMTFAPGSARIRIGAGTFLNLGVMIAAMERVEIGDHCMFANGCFITDGSHRFDDPDAPTAAPRRPLMRARVVPSSAHPIRRARVTGRSWLVISADGPQRGCPAGLSVPRRPSRALRQPDCCRWPAAHGRHVGRPDHPAALESGAPRSRR